MTVSAWQHSKYHIQYLDCIWTQYITRSIPQNHLWKCIYDLDETESEGWIHSVLIKMYRNLENVQLQSCGIMNCLICIQIKKGNYSWIPIGNMLWNNVNMFIHIDYLITKLDIISVSNSAYTSTGLIIPPSFINTG